MTLWEAVRKGGLFHIQSSSAIRVGRKFEPPANASPYDTRFFIIEG
jgi:hypothetical protein